MPGYRPHRGRGGGSFGKRGSGRGRGGRPRTQTRDTFMTSRLKETEDDVAQDGSEGEADEPNDMEEDAEEDDLDNQSASEDEAPASNSYSALLQSLTVPKDNPEPARKKRRIENGNEEREQLSTSKGKSTTAVREDGVESSEQAEQLLELQEEVEEDDEDQAQGSEVDVDSEDEERLLKDPFERHYMAVEEQDLKEAIKQVDGKQWQSLSSTVEPDIRKTALSRNDPSTMISEAKSTRDLFLKQRLVDSGAKFMSTTTPLEKSIAGSMFNYVDILSGARNLKNASRIRDLSCLHALNHVLKTRDRVLKNSAKLNAQSAGTEALDLRDQGFTRPKVLLIVPTKQACVRFVESIVKLSEPDQQENKGRFLDTFSHEDEEEWKEKPEDFQELFGGNHEEDFRIGLKFTRKTIKYFSGFYNSDIIIGSPLGLMRTITTGGGGSKDKKKSHDADFLSSIEIVIMDHANALQMQNWQHVDYVFSQLNHLPKDSHGCDFSRVRHWYLDGQAKYLRQTIILSDYLTPEINSLVSSQLHNIAGRVKFQPTYNGAILGISTLLTLPVPQTFVRIPSPNPQADSDARFKFFTTSVLPPLVRDARHQKGILLFVPNYADFVRLRNHLSTSPDATSLSFGVVSEYTPVRDVMRARAHFLSGRHSLLLYSERAHHHFRYRIRGVRRVIFYGVPENPIFWTEIVSLLGLAGAAQDKNKEEKAAVKQKAVVRALFSKWDALKLERVVGTDRVGRLLHDRAGDTFDFV